MQLTHETHEDIHIFAPDGRIDGRTYKDLEGPLLTAIEEGATRVLLDFAAVDYISSVGLRVLLQAAKRLKPASGTLLLAGLPPSVREVFDISGFLSLFPTAEDREAGLAALR